MGRNRISKIDINQPVKQGHDLVLNDKNGGQRLGSTEEFNAARDNDELINLAPNDNPDGPQKVINNDSPVPKESRDERKAREKVEAKAAKKNDKK